MRIHPAAWSLLLLLAAGIVAAGYYLAPERSDVAPPYRGPTTDNATFDLQGERGRVVVLDFFNIYCEGCAIIEQDLATLEPTWNETEVRVVSIGVAPFNSLEELTAYQDQHNLSWTVVRDTEGALEKFGVIALPTLAVVDQDGTIVFHRGGLPGRDAIALAVDEALTGRSQGDAFARYPLWALAAVAAVASFFSPCAVGLLPAYAAHALRSSGGGPARAAKFGALAAAGLLLVFLGLGGLAFAFGRAVAPFVPWLAPAMGLVFVAVGLLLLMRPYSLWLQRFFSPLTQVPTDARGGLSYFLYGIGYGAGAAGCTAPVLLGLVALAGASSAATGALALMVYALTAAALMALVTIAIAAGRERAGRWIVRHAHRIEVLSALAFVAAGLFLLWFARRAGTISF